jgi:hypothetical protein
VIVFWGGIGLWLGRESQRREREASAKV